jgi:hypothetical protein
LLLPTQCFLPIWLEIECQKIHHITFFMNSKPNYCGRVSFQIVWINSYKCDYRVEVNFWIGFVQLFVQLFVKLFVQLFPGVTDALQSVWQHRRQILMRWYRQRDHVLKTGSYVVLLRVMATMHSLIIIATMITKYGR